MNDDLDSMNDLDSILAEFGGSAPQEEAPAQETKKKKKKARAEEPVPAAPEKREKERRTFPHGKQNRGDLQAFLDAQPKEEAPVVMAHRNPLEGDVIMDATARLLAPRKPLRTPPPAPRAAEPLSAG